VELKQLLEWYNLVFIVPFLLGFAFLLMQMVGLGEGDFDGDADADMDHDVDVDADMDHDVDVDADIDADVDADLDADADVDADMDHDADVDQDMDHDADAGGKTIDYAHGPSQGHDGDAVVQGSAFWKIALLLGVGRVPISIMFMALCFSWGIIGLGSNIILSKLIASPIFFFLPSLAAAIVLSFAFTSASSRVISKIIPKTTTFSTRESDLVGKIGTSLYKINDKSGTVRAENEYGAQQQYSAYSLKGDEIPGSTRVLLVKYDKDRGAFAVERLPEELED
jgi:ABC-type nickel/cobalt efflux system permease component RcnA